MSTPLSKSDYLLFLKHPAWVWLKKHNIKKLPPVDDNLQAIYDAGHLFETYAERLFLGIVRLGFQGRDEYQSLEKKDYLKRKSEQRFTLTVRSIYR